MTFHRRIRTIYGKELVDILRDRRTLIAMIVVPIVLYPLLMLGSIQAVSIQTDSIGRERLLIGVIDEDHASALQYLVDVDSAALERERKALDPDSVEASMLPVPLQVAIRPFASKERVEELVRQRLIHAGVIFDSPNLMDFPEVQNHVSIHVDQEGIRSDHAGMQLERLFERTRERTVERRKRERNLPETFDRPFMISVVDLSAPPSILGQILPLILILMTITGAIYPAIDLTAGERERGTLESLMVSPVPVIDLIVGKFLVVTTVAIMGAALNLGSVTATVYFGGFQKMIATTGGSLPYGKMLLILVCLIPFAVLMSAIMIAVCSYARTFKEAQNYVTPVILAVLIPGGLAALPATRLDGVMLVMPVGNMVLLARDLLLGAAVSLWHIVMVLLSTTLYAGAAVAVAANIFGKESVVFADAASLRSSFSRSVIRPSARPGVSMGLLVVALLFPVWFFVQAAFSQAPDENAAALLFATGTAMPVLFVVLPVILLSYWRVGIQETLALRLPSLRHLVAAVLLGLSAWVPAHELNMLQERIVGVPQAVMDSAKTMGVTFQLLPAASVFVLIAVIPAFCEELLFRGFLLSSLRTSARKWTAIIAAAAIFGVFHFFLFKFAVTASLGVLLGYLCWQSRSVVPAIIAHLLHNSIGVSSVLYPGFARRLGVPQGDEWVHLPAGILILGGVVFLVGLLMTARPTTRPTEQPLSI